MVVTLTQLCESESPLIAAIAIHHHVAAARPVHVVLASVARCTDPYANGLVWSTGSHVVRFPDGTTATLICHGANNRFVAGGKAPINPTYATTEGGKHFRNDDGF
jgi:hypothetical protein